MNVCGIIAEYNPLHNGHRYHLSQARKETQSGFVVVAMSGSFTQRGEPAVFDKWARARWALLNGADLVIELPALYCLQSAEFFALRLRARGRGAYGPGRQYPRKRAPRVPGGA